VKISEEDLTLQTDASLASYRAYLRAQELRDRIDESIAAGGGHGQIAALRGAGEPGDPDILYGSIYETPVDEETVVGLQHKLLFILNILQGADARPTPQALEAVVKLQVTLEALEERWEELRR
jgi:hypothetical protein